MIQYRVFRNLDKEVQYILKCSELNKCFDKKISGYDGRFFYFGFMSVAGDDSLNYAFLFI